MDRGQAVPPESSPSARPTCDGATTGQAADECKLINDQVRDDVAAMEPRCGRPRTALAQDIANAPHKKLRWGRGLAGCGQSDVLTVTFAPQETL
ncbi:hypothetical protein [Streptomyces carpinensis]|uniref:Uncharacterized protein n=1 Tax=Streptomyces carpinensis TaxID=66369 RepID=A0ABV1VYV2_9ACTN|nr:hypothetical protein [Streptomyces carpinensis]